MKIELNEPFKSLWKSGYIIINPENRRNVCLVNNNQDRTTISYARYLMCVKLGYILSQEFEVDHIDNDKTNDDIDNLQVLTKEQNKLKHDWLYNAVIQQWHILPCTYCNGLFYITNRDLRFRKIETICCSRSCSTKFYFHNKT